MGGPSTGLQRVKEVIVRLKTSLPLPKPKKILYKQSLTKTCDVFAYSFLCSLSLVEAMEAWQSQGSKCSASHSPSTALSIDTQMGKWDTEKFCISGPRPPGPYGYGCRLVTPEAGLPPQGDRAEPPGHGWDTGHLETVLCFCSNKSCHCASSPPMHGSLKYLSWHSMEEPYFYRQHINLFNNS